MIYWQHDQHGQQRVHPIFSSATGGLFTSVYTHDFESIALTSKPPMAVALLQHSGSWTSGRR